MEIDDREKRIVALFANRDNRAAKELYDAYAGYLTGVCARYLSYEDDLKDVVQESFINILNAFATFHYSGKGALKAWITKIAINQSLRYLRENNRFIHVPISNQEAEIPEEEPDIGMLTQKEIVSLIRELPPGYRAVFNLHVIDGKPHKEIAAILGIKENSVASQFHRAKAMLAARVKELVNKKRQLL
ncbi:MAG: RNA polymerase sigma factor [Muribaculum sp.]|nr:RNA polymerase sigma factor [Muribaculum sp.]